MENGERKEGNIWRRQIFSQWKQRKAEKEKREIIGEDKYLVRGSKEKGRRKWGNIWRRQIFCKWKQRKAKNEKGEIFGEEQYLVRGRAHIK